MLEKPAKSTGRPLGATGEAVRSNIRAIRDGKGISAPELSQRLKELDRAIPPLGIHRIEAGDRRVDVDDLVAFAVALGVSPVTLLMPKADGPRSPVAVTGEELELHAARVWAWLTTEDSFPQTPKQVEVVGPMTRMMFVGNAWPTWRQELEDEVNFSSHPLRAVVSGIEVETRVRCLDDNHPPGCYHPGLNVTFCHCGRVRYSGTTALVRWPDRDSRLTDHITEVSPAVTHQ